MGHPVNMSNTGRPMYARQSSDIENFKDGNSGQAIDDTVDSRNRELNLFLVASGEGHLVYNSNTGHPTYARHITSPDLLRADATSWGGGGMQLIE